MSSTVIFKKQGQGSLWHSEVHSITKHNPTCLLQYTKLKTVDGFGDLWFPTNFITYSKIPFFSSIIGRTQMSLKPMQLSEVPFLTTNGTTKHQNSNQWTGLKKKWCYLLLYNLKKHISILWCWISSSPPHPEVIQGSQGSMFDTFTNHPGPPFVHPKFHSK